tara:strand:- start:66 stop:323 length:258 start_codon:yes stop_codon:yes gene_type:complete
MLKEVRTSIQNWKKKQNEHFKVVRKVQDLRLSVQKLENAAARMKHSIEHFIAFLKCHQIPLNRCISQFHASDVDEWLKLAKYEGE